MSKGPEKVINMKINENSGNIEDFCNLSTLSTQKAVILVDYSNKIKELMFC